MMSSACGLMPSASAKMTSRKGRRRWKSGPDLHRRGDNTADMAREVNLGYDYRDAHVQCPPADTIQDFAP